MAETRRAHIEFDLSLEDLEARRFPDNPKEHDDDAIGEAYDDRGYVTPMLIDERSGLIAEGHGRLTRLQNDKAEGKKRPLGVEERGGKWFPPVVRGVKFRNVDELRRHVLGANRIVERGGWNNQLLPKLLGKLGDGKLAGSGFRDRELVRFMASTTGQVADEDDVPEAPAEPTTKPGDLWQLGEHRLLCGDSFKKEDRARLIGKLRVDMILMDPPYAIYGSSTGIGADIADDKMVRPFFENLCKVAIETVKPFGHVYVCCDWRGWAALWDGAQRARLSPKNCLVWDKGGSGLGSNYANTYELVGFFSRLPPPKAMKSSTQTGQRTVHASNVLRFPRPSGDERKHNAAKPVGMFRELVENSSDKGEVVIDFFGGSGPTLIAAHKAERRALTMEIEPRNCDIIVARFESVTGTKARRL